MSLLIISFISGVLTVLAPCTLPVLPIIVGGSLQGKASKWKPYIITGSLALSIILFTLLLKASTVFIDVPQAFWAYFSGSILITFGLISLFPKPWVALSAKLKFSQRSNLLLADSANKKSGVWSDVLIGASLGPVFSSCSPTYFVILATVLPQDFATGLVYLLAYALGLMLVLLLIALLGQKFVKKLQWAANPEGWFKRILGIIFILVGLFVITGFDKKVQVAILESGYFNITNFEQKLLEQTEMEMDMEEILKGTTLDLSKPGEPSKINKAALYPKYQEIVNPAGYVNTEGITLGELVGEKVILIDFMTYSCINCIRTFPFLADWYDKYEDQGLEIVGIHTPEFAFEHKLENVQAAAQEYNLKFPIVLDNDYSTWRAYENRFWPHKFLIDIDGYIVYDHIGEGDYDETEMKIQELLAERMQQLGEAENMAVGVNLSNIVSEQVDFGQRRTPELYIGAWRNSQIGNVQPGAEGIFDLDAETVFQQDQFYLAGTWNITAEYAENLSAGATITLRYQGQKVFIVVGTKDRVKLHLKLDGHELGTARGQHVADDDTVIIEADDLYRLIEADEWGQHVLEITIEEPGLQAFAFTFG